LAVLGALRGRQVVLVDGDLGLANLHLILGVEPQNTLASLLEPGRRSRPELLTPGPAGLLLVPGASGMGRLAGLNRGELRRLVYQLEPYVQGGELVIIDLASGISPSTRLFLQAAQEIILVANPEPSAVLDAYGVIKLLSESGHAGRIHLVMNRARDPRAGRESAERIRGTAQRFLDRCVNHLGTVPEDEAMITAVRRQRPVVLDRPDSPAADALGRIADQLLVDEMPGRNTLSTFFSTAKNLVAPRRRSKRSSCAL
jgi:flagellar biosynthesis protein FlhG